MKLYSEGKNYKLYEGNSLDILEIIEPNSIDSIVTDPPYELNFMSKDWDNSGIAFNTEIWQKCWQVLKPGGYLLAFGGTRTFHRIACAIEDAGFEIRDTIMWLYGSGFPKSLNIAKSIEGKLTLGSANTKDYKKLNGELIEKTGLGFAKNQFEQGIRPINYNENGQKILGKLEPTTELAKQWAGWGTALKPAYEPIIIARKPIENSVADNVLKYGVGGINIDECRIYNNEIISSHDTQKGTFAGKTQTTPSFKGKNKLSFGQYYEPAERIEYTQHEGRFPSNVILTYNKENENEVCGEMPETTGSNRHNTAIRVSEKNSGYGFDINTRNEYNDEGNASRYFYCAKASKKDRDMGLNGFEEKIECDRNEECYSANVPFNRSSLPKRNIHPTVKPTELMQYLIRLVSPKGATILDIFNGSGSTGKAVMFENKEHEANYKYIGVDLSDEYLAISQARIEFAEKYEEEQEIKVGDKVLQQMSFFDLLGDENEK